MVNLKVNTSSLNKYYRISPQSKNNNININDYVKNNNNLYGIIKNKDDQYIVIAWNDNTYERIQLATLNKAYLTKISENEYVDTIESQISPLQGSSINTAFIQNASIQNNNINKDKSEIQKLVDLAVEKGIIDQNDVDVEITKIESFDDQAFKQYKDMVLNFVDDGEVTSLSNEEIDTSGLSPKEIQAQNMLKQLKHQHGISSTRQKNIDINTTDSRSLKDLNDQKITFANTNNGTDINISTVSLEDSLMNSLQNDNNIIQNNNNQLIDTEMDIDNIGFNNDINISLNEKNKEELSLDSIMNQLNNENKEMNKNNSFLGTPFNGITKPLLINSSDNINPVNAAFRDLFSLDMWTVMSKR